MIQYGNNCRYIKQAEQPIVKRCFRCGQMKPANNFKHATFNGKRVQMFSTCALFITNEQRNIIWKKATEQDDEDGKCI